MLSNPGRDTHVFDLGSSLDYDEIGEAWLSRSLWVKRRGAIATRATLLTIFSPLSSLGWEVRQHPLFLPKQGGSRFRSDFFLVFLGMASAGATFFTYVASGILLHSPLTHHRYTATPWT